MQVAKMYTIHITQKNDINFTKTKWQRIHKELAFKTNISIKKLIGFWL